MAFKKEFNNKIRQAFDNRTKWLRDSIWGTNPGRPHEWTKGKRNKTIKELQDIVEKALTKKFTRYELNPTSKRWRQVNGHGRDEKRNSLPSGMKKKSAIRTAFISFLIKKMRYMLEEQKGVRVGLPAIFLIIELRAQHVPLFIR